MNVVWFVLWFLAFVGVASLFAWAVTGFEGARNPFHRRRPERDYDARLESLRIYAEGVLALRQSKVESERVQP